MKVNFAPSTPEYKKKGLRKALKAAHSPEARRKAAATMRKTMAARKAARLNGHIPAGQHIIPLEQIEGERAPVIRLSDTPGGGQSTRSQRMTDERVERIKLAQALVATVHKMVNG